MNSHSGTKRARQPDSPRAFTPPSEHSQSQSSAPSASSNQGGSASSFRNVSACNRCRLRKNRCDQNLPHCTSCEKARVKCVGYDPITKREIPRAYVYYLESRVSYLESLLSGRGIAFAPAEDFDLGTKPIIVDHSSLQSPGLERASQHNGSNKSPEGSGESIPATGWDHKQDEAEKLDKLVSNIGLVSVQGASDPRYLGSTSGISFARVVFAAVRSSVPSSNSERAGIRPSKPTDSGAAAVSGTSMRDSFFGLQSKPAFKKAPFPDRDVGARLVNLYFEHANPQIPILHRGEFMSLFDRAYASDERKRSPRELYMLNIVFAIGSGIILDSPNAGSPASASATSAVPIKTEPPSPMPKKVKLSTQQSQPEEYHASAMVHLENFLGSTPAADRPEGFGGSLEELQAVLLLAGFALLRPVAPGLWYIVGVAVRLAVDLGLHYEDGTGIDENGAPANAARPHDVVMQAAGVHPRRIDHKERGRREWVRDLRRRLWWCVYSFDRLVSTCVGRPFGITDQVITTEFPSILDDNYITTSGFTSHAYSDPSYKRVAHHYFRLRILQSEIMHVLQYRQAHEARKKGRNSTNEFMHTKLPNPFLESFDTFVAWRKDIDRRLWEWKESAPTQKETTVQFSVQFLELNYWQAVIMLYRQSLTVPPALGGEVSPSDEIASPMSVNIDDQEDDDDVFLKVAEAGQKVLKLYRQLHRVHLVNYTFLATHHLFMAGIAFLYAIWHSATVRSQLTLDDVDFTVLAATSVLGDLVDKCPPAEACRDAFDRMSKATVHMCLSTTGFGARIPRLTPPQRPAHSRTPSAQSQSQSQSQPPPPPSQPQGFVQAQNDHGYFRPQRPRPQFDMNLRDLFPEETHENGSFARNIGRWQLQPQQLQQHIGPPPPLTPQTSLYADVASSPSPAPPAQLYHPPPQQQQQHASPYVQTYALQQQQGLLPLMAPAPTPNGYDCFGYHHSEIDSLLADSTAQYPGQPGYSLGFDSEHDWSEGAGPDLFDGFFFGGGGGGGGGSVEGGAVEL
ncbi:Fungal specific transcription factor [Xylographa pallens]|nr:Fungal specific transcription factor [Xylographa pallens]